MTSKPSGTVTFLFTDIENSTQLAREHLESWEAAKARHHTILQEAIERNNGFIFQIIGDAFCAAFHKAGDALKAAIKVQQNLQDEPWDDVTIYVRMGIHTGEAEFDGSEYRGYAALSFVQRLISAGHGGQILVSNTTENLLREQLSGRISLRDMGIQKFAYMPSPVRVFQVIAPDLPSEFPPLRTLDNLPNNLPTQLTSFVGRERELADAKRLLQDAHLLTLIGPGGTGKTRLSIQAASEMLDQYPDGAWFVELAPILDPLLVPRTTAIAIGLRDEPQRPVIDMLCDYLRQKRILIILDNCEHLVDACAQMADRILHAALDTRILASSREAFGIGGEVTYRVPSLGLPDLSHLPPVESLSQYEAVKLFIDRATSAVPSFTVTNANAPALAQVCYHLDGIPLALELAAAKIRVLSLEQIAKRLDDRFRLLTGGSRTVMERHQTLRAAIDWSYNLLSPAEQILFARLSVFIGGWGLEAAESVCSDDTVKSEDVLDLLEQLINKSLVIKEEVENESRYRMLETIRQYAHEKLVEAGESDALREKHLAYFVILVEQAEPELYRPNQISWFQRLDEELDNFRLALEWSLATDIESGLRIAAIPWRFWQRLNFLEELVGWLRKLLERYPEPDSLRAQALVAYCVYILRYGDFVEARKAGEQSLQLARSVADRQTEGLSLLYLGLTFQAEHFQKGTPFLEQSLALYRTLEDKMGQADALFWLCWNKVRVRHNAEDGRPFLLESLQLHRDLGNLTGIADCLSELAPQAIWAGDFSSPLPWLEEARKIYHDLGNQSDEAGVIVYFGTIAYSQGNYQQARAYFEESLTLFGQGGTWWSIYTNVNLAYMDLREGHIQKARIAFAEVIQQTYKDNHIDALVWATEGIASLHVNQRQFVGAARLFAWVDAMREKLGASRAFIEQNFYERDLAVIHAKLDKAEFAKFSIEGRALTTEQAIALALEPVEEIIELKIEPATIPSQREAEKQKYGGLTEREREVSAQIAQGKSNQAIAAELFIGLKTVEANVTRILSKLGFTSRAQIAAWAVAKGLAEAPRDLDTLSKG